MFIFNQSTTLSLTLFITALANIKVRKMSDKFFFKGRQDARASHIKYGYKAKDEAKLGTKKRPLDLIVTTQARKQELLDVLESAQIVGTVTLDTSEGAIESTAALTALLNKQQTVTVQKVPNRNEPCICGSGKKYKKCCG